MREVSDKIWITDIRTAMRENLQEFDLVLTVCEDGIEDLVSCRYKHVDLPTASRACGGPGSYDTFTDVVDVLEQALAKDQTVLVHCHSGIGRTAAVSAAGLASHRDTNFESAFDSITDIYPSADPSDLHRNYGKRYTARSPTPLSS